MATRSTIGMELDDGKVIQIYCHNDGYPSYNGKVLLEHYKDKEKVEKMIRTGDMSSLGKEIGKSHDFNDASEDYCTYYKRDRNETDANCEEFVSLEECRKNGRSESYNYMFIKGIWYVDGDKVTKKMVANQER